VKIRPPLVKTRNERLEDFFAAQCEHFFLDGGDLEYSDWLELGEKYGLLKQVEYDPAMHGEMEDVEPGDMIYWPTSDEGTA
jgi:hypothetical protein